MPDTTLQEAIRLLQEAGGKLNLEYFRLKESPTPENEETRRVLAETLRQLATALLFLRGH